MFQAIRAGDFLRHQRRRPVPELGIAGTGPRHLDTAEVEWTFPSEFAEPVHLGDRLKTAPSYQNVNLSAICNSLGFGLKAVAVTTPKVLD